MHSANAFELQHSELNGFLFADIGVDAVGMDLSVLSALAREGIDPWQEAARLARLPWMVAVDELAQLIAAMPDSTWPLPVARVLATRLVRLLPRRDGQPSLLAQERDAVNQSAPPPSFGRTWLPVILLGIAVLLGCLVSFGRIGPGLTGLTQPSGMEQTDDTVQPPARP